MKLLVNIASLFLFIVSIITYSQDKPIQFGEEIEMDDLVACLASIVTLISFGTVIIFIGGVKKTKKVESKRFNFAQADHPRDGYGEAKWERLI